MERDRLSGAIHVSAPNGQQSWGVQLTLWPNTYELAAREEIVAGQYEEVLAEFAGAADTVWTVDGTGRVSFQAANSGCIGEGHITPHLDGSFGVYDVVVTIENCSPTHSSLNRRFEGLASATPSSYWDYDSVLRMWLSSTSPSSPPAAITMLGRPTG
jgi:hypothetical protein